MPEPRRRVSGDPCRGLPAFVHAVGAFEVDDHIADLEVTLTGVRPRVQYDDSASSGGPDRPVSFYPSRCFNLRLKLIPNLRQTA